MDPTERFTGRAREYARYRPTYPEGVVHKSLIERCGLGPNSHVADVGAGTGIFTRDLLQTGAKVTAVEPNREMREQMFRAMGAEPRLSGQAGSATATGLPNASVDLIACAQAFHWFPGEPTRVEFRRILRLGGFVALIWNTRIRSEEGFLGGYDDLLRAHSPEYVEKGGVRQDEGAIQALYAGPFVRLAFDNSQNLDLESLRGRAVSTSYVPKPGDPGHTSFMDGLDRLFATYAEGGQIRIPYETALYLGTLSG